MPWLLLFAAIVAEVVATSMLKSTAGFTRLGPSVVVVLAYGRPSCCCPCLKKMPVGVVYAVWSGSAWR
jgi:small multidrug resistance pump